MAWRYLAQAALTGELLDLDLPITRAPGGLSWALSGPGALVGTIASDYAELRWSNGAPVLGEFSTYLYAEENGYIRWGGILHKSTYAGPVWSLEAYGFSSYPAGIPYTGDLYTGIAANPVRVFKDIWEHVQDQPDGDLGLAVVGGGGCTVNIGTKDEPYSLAWWEAPDCGSELDTLTSETPFDYVEAHEWGRAYDDATGATTWEIRHQLEISYPRRGYRRTDLVFNEDNVSQVVELTRDGTTFANVVYVLGKGEGKKTLRGESSTRDGRLRRPYVHTDKLASTTARVKAIAARERGLRSLGFDLASVSVFDHPNAPIGSWQLGDDILVALTVPDIGPVALWCRVVGWQLDTDTSATLQLQRADAFAYGAAELPPDPVYAPASTVLSERFATFNFHRSSADDPGHSWNSRKAAALAAVAAVNPSVLFAQECTPTQRAAVVDATGYAYASKGNVVLFWKPSVWQLVGKADTYRIDKSPDDRWLVAATLQHIGTGKSLRVASTHVTNLDDKSGGDTWKVAQMRQIMSYESKLQVIGADFNSSADVYKTALAEGNLGTSRAKCPPANMVNLTMNSSHHGYVNTKSKGRRIDEVLSRTDVVVLSAGILNTDGTTSYPNASDHNIVYANLGV